MIFITEPPITFKENTYMIYQIWKRIGFIDDLPKTGIYKPIFHLYRWIGVKFGYTTRLNTFESWLKDTINEKNEIQKLNMVIFGYLNGYMKNHSNEVDKSGILECLKLTQQC